jgi:two-component system, OmpR family, sensor kinase
VTRVPIRLRLTLVFTVAMAVVLAGAGWFLYARVASDLSTSLDQQLRSRAQDVSALVRRAGSLEAAHGDLIESGETFAELLAPDGRVLQSTSPIGHHRLLTASEVEDARGDETFVDRDAVPGLDEPARLLAIPLGSRANGRVLVVGATRENRAETLTSLRDAFLIGGPVALVLTALAGYALAGAALAPIEAMRRRAAAISASSLDERLPLPRARDEVFRLGATLNEMLARLEETLARERRFVADASHELRSPLALLKTELELALRGDRSPDELEAALRSGAVETDRLAQLADDLLVLARADQGQLPLRREPVPADRLLTRVAARFSSRSKATGRSIDVDAAEGLVAAADELRLEQALGNLLENAFRHAGGSIRLVAAEHDGLVEFRVTDQGPGFPPEFLPRAFDRFSRADDARSGDGAGLGLTIAEVIATAHGGSVGAANREGGGADVWLAIPKTR